MFSHCSINWCGILGRPVVRMLCFQCQGHVPIPGWKLKSHKLHGKKSTSVFEHGHLPLVIKISISFCSMQCMQSLMSTRIISLGVLQDGDILSFLWLLLAGILSLKQFSLSITLLNQRQSSFRERQGWPFNCFPHLPLLRIIYRFPSMIQRRLMKFLWIYQF